jgi:hypothetical protein
MACSRAGSCFFEGRLRGRIALRVRGAGLLAREVQAPKQARQPPQAVAHAIPALDVRAQIDQTPGANPVALRRRPAQNVRLERGLLPRAQPLGAPRARLVVKPRGARRVEAQHRIAQRLPLHPGQAGRLGARHAFERVGNGEEPQGGSGSRPASRRSSEGE